MRSWAVSSTYSGRMLDPADGPAGSPMTKLLKWGCGFGRIVEVKCVGLRAHWRGHANAVCFTFGGFERMRSWDYMPEEDTFMGRSVAQQVYADFL